MKKHIKSDMRSENVTTHFGAPFFAGASISGISGGGASAASSFLPAFLGLSLRFSHTRFAGSSSPSLPSLGISVAVKKGAKKKQKKRVSKLKSEEQAPELPAIEDTPPRTVPGWVTTFADLMSLLMVFFVMLVSVSTIEKTTFEKMVKSMKSELGGGQTKDDVETVEVTDSVETVEEVGEATEKVVEELKEELKVEIKKKNP